MPSDQAFSFFPKPNLCTGVPLFPLFSPTLSPVRPVRRHMCWAAAGTYVGLFTWSEVLPPMTDGPADNDAENPPPPPLAVAMVSKEGDHGTCRGGQGVLIKAFTLSGHQAWRKCEKLLEVYLKGLIWTYECLESVGNGFYVFRLSHVSEYW